MRALVHIGFHKTGSTSIQVNLAKSKSLLARNGFIYPFLKVKNQHWSLGVQFLPKAENHYLIREIGFPDQTQLNKWFEEINLKLDEQIMHFNGHTCILSAELFSVIPAYKLTEFRSFLTQRFDSIKIVAYVRPAEKLYESLLQEWAKQGKLLENIPLPNDFKLRSKIKLEGYLKEFDQENISIVKFAPASLYEGDIVKDFQQRFLITENHDVISLNSIKFNESITAAGVVFLLLFSQKIPRYLNNSLNPKWKAVTEIILKITPSKTLPKLKIPDRWKQIIKQNHQEEYLWLEDTFFDGIRGIFSSPLITSTEAQKVTKDEFEAWLMSYLTPEAKEKISQLLTQANVLTPEEIDKVITSSNSAAGVNMHESLIQKSGDIAMFKTYVDEGIKLKKEGNLASAIEKFDQALQLNPKCIPAFNHLAEIYESRKEFDQAIIYLQQVIEFQPNNGLAHVKLARAMMAQKNIQGAITSYQKAIALQPEQPAWVYHGLGDALNQNGQVEQAIAAYQKAIEIVPDHSILHAKLARAMMAQKNIQGAITSYQKAIALQPEQPAWVYHGLGDALNQNGQIDEATVAHEKAIEIKKYKNRMNMSTEENSKMETERMRAARDLLSPDKVFMDIDDDFWLWMHTDGIIKSSLLQSLLPPLPKKEVMLKYNGTTGATNLSHGLKIYQLVKKLAEQHVGKLKNLDGILDYGCGWGRVLRFFLKDIKPDKLWGIDCDPQAIDICKRTLPGVNISLVDPRPPSLLPSKHFDIIYSNSVFSHLNEEVHLQWLNEFERIIKPGGLVILTTWGRGFFDSCEKAREDYENGIVDNKKVNLRRKLFVGKQWPQKYDNGEFCHVPGTQWDFFGNTCISKKYVQNNWLDSWSLIDFIDDLHRFPQAVIILTKQSTSLSR